MTVIPGCNVGCNADYRRNDYYYVRVSKPGAWETRARAPLRSWFKLIAEALWGAALIIAGMWVLGNLAEWYAAWEGISP